MPKALGVKLIDSQDSTQAAKAAAVQNGPYENMDKPQRIQQFDFRIRKQSNERINQLKNSNSIPRKVDRA